METGGEDLGSGLRRMDEKLVTDFSCQADFYLTMPGDGRQVPAVWIKENRMFGAFAMENATLFQQIADEVPAFHLVILGL